MFKPTTLLLAAPMLLALPSFAQATATGEPAEPNFNRPSRAITSSLSFGFEFLEQTEMDEGGTVEVSRYSADTEVNFPLGDDSMFTLDLGFEHSNYNFDEVFLIPDTDNPVSQINTYSARGTLYTPFDHERMALLLGAGVQLAGEFDADVSNSITYDVTTGIIYNHDPDISIGLAIVVASQLEDDPLIVPLPILRYKFNDQWELATEGARIELTYDHSQSLSFGSYIAWEKRSFRLESGSGLSSDAVITENRVPLGVFAIFSPGPGIEIRGDVFSSIYTKFEARATDESEISDDTADAGLGFGITAIFRF